MDDRTWKERLTAAMAEPKAPPKLVDDTVARVQTLYKGQEAEKRLRQEKTLSEKDRAELAADGVLGRLARSGTLPLGADTAALKRQLLTNERFTQLSRQPGRSIVGGLENGELMKSMVQPSAKPPAKAIQPPVLGK